MGDREPPPPLVIDLGLYLHEAGGRARLGWGQTPFLQPAELVALVEGLYAGYLRVVPASPIRKPPPPSDLLGIRAALERRPHL